MGTLKARKPPRLRLLRSLTAPNTKAVRNAQLRLIALVAIVAWLLVGKEGGILPSPKPDIDVEGFHVLLVYDAEARDKITAGQGSVLNSVKVSQWVESKGGELRRYDVRDSLETLGDGERAWQEMHKLAADPPQMVTLKDGRAEVQKIPDGIEATIRALEQLK